MDRKKIAFFKFFHIVTVITATITLLVSSILIVKLIFADFAVSLERSVALETYYQSSLSPHGSTESWEEMQENIKKSFAEKEKWAYYMVLNIPNKSTRNTNIFLLILAFLSSLFFILLEHEVMKKVIKRKNSIKTQ